jgi:hypothetical protein
MIQYLYVSWELNRTLTNFKSNVYLSNVQKRYQEKYSNSLCRPAEYRKKVVALNFIKFIHMELYEFQREIISG